MSQQQRRRAGVHALAGLLAAWLLSGSVAASRPVAADDPSRGAANTCQDVPATIVGAPGVRLLEGTAGPDVIITGGARSVNAKAGDEIVCVTGATMFAAGASGNDVVSTSGGSVAVGFERRG
jgi:hypothetical protein